ncbi:DNA-3-methyladenine glycosylase I [Quadrisphaera sp. DSM 44207]|uniref:DNA-3-methyladenine glycosylase I n=1 Tax=Quadrisphaera sp. DSM 44207 TaxID=1881057 RepID=UPI000B85F6BE
MPGPDGVLRCPWGVTGPADYRAYHDAEWGRPVRGEAALYERLVLEGFQAGLSWLVVLRKRPALRAAFAGFDPEVVAGFGPDDVARVLADPGVVRNRAKVEAAVRNARAVLALRERAPGGLEALIAEGAPPPGPAPRTPADVPAQTPASRALARRLAAAGFSFVGPRTVHALLQACGFVDDHLAACAFRRGARGAA